MEHMLDKDVERVLFSEEELHRRVAEIAAEIDRDYAGREPLLVSVLRGSFVFMADLVRQIHLPLHRGLHGGVLLWGGHGQLRAGQDHQGSQRAHRGPRRDRGGGHSGQRQHP